ncbi:hypothetical protein YH66_09695 [[Brevibacterium] flavum]|uniref:Uncharacterized protein n=1 Tax=[Brevibacterium] flavum TaxID=92706 RepID=A0A0F6Z5R8_9CORY|nr:hypothetical protein YH66_09695 [[Brevibacterium] flavum]ANE08635.1 hypothetical protein A3654_09755 [Corynebacterium glutamicum]AST21048.1 hypothetical protein CEY17_09835 [Corynebacterium glutamicum ATCC 14067]KEI23557.1 hypothetical protein KIQ_013605 [Corynebacterium glutamicum ATCC 14067]KIH73305.1 hypothetical protein SD36_09725 [Corynebacterium glutamicum]
MNRWEVKKKDPDNVFWGPDGLLWVANPIDYPMRSRGFTNHSAAITYAHQAASGRTPVYVDNERDT